MRPKAGRDLCERALLRLAQSSFRHAFLTIFRSYSDVTAISLLEFRVTFSYSDVKIAILLKDGSGLYDP